VAVRSFVLSSGLASVVHSLVTRALPLGEAGDSREAAERQPRGSREAAEREPRGSREGAEREPRCKRGGAESRRSCSSTRTTRRRRRCERRCGTNSLCDVSSFAPRRGCGRRRPRGRGRVCAAAPSGASLRSPSKPQLARRCKRCNQGHLWCSISSDRSCHNRCKPRCTPRPTRLLLRGWQVARRCYGWTAATPPSRWCTHPLPPRYPNPPSPTVNLGQSQVHGPAEADSLCAVVSALQTHCSAAPPDSAHLLRRRAASLLGHSLSAPELVKRAAHEQAGEGRSLSPPHARSLGPDIRARAGLHRGLVHATGHAAAGPASRRLPHRRHRDTQTHRGVRRPPGARLPSGPSHSYALATFELGLRRRAAHAAARRELRAGGAASPPSRASDSGAEITRDHPRSPEITRDHPRSPEITRDHPRSPKLLLARRSLSPGLKLRLFRPCSEWLEASRSRPGRCSHAPPSLAISRCLQVPVLRLALSAREVRASREPARSRRERSARDHVEIGRE